VRDRSSISERRQLSETAKQFGVIGVCVDPTKVSRWSSDEPEGELIRWSPRLGVAARRRAPWSRLRIPSRPIRCALADAPVEINLSW